MASSMIHLAITKGLTEERETKALERLFLGSILPDGAVSGNSHLKKCLTDNDFTYDLEFFRTRFGEQMQKDPLYLGYYLHLVQDLFFRNFIYGEYHFDSSIPGNVEKLHHDYAVLNGYVAETNGLKAEMLPVQEISREPLLELATFDVPGLVREVWKQFVPPKEEPAFVFHKRNGRSLYYTFKKALPTGAGGYFTRENWHKQCCLCVEAAGQVTVKIPPIRKFFPDWWDFYRCCQSFSIDVAYPLQFRLAESWCFLILGIYCPNFSIAVTSGSEPGRLPENRRWEQSRGPRRCRRTAEESGSAAAGRESVSSGR